VMVVWVNAAVLVICEHTTYHHASCLRLLLPSLYALAEEETKTGVN